MKKKINLFALLSLFVLVANAQSNLKQSFINLENKWMNSWKNKDEKTFKAILNDDFQLISSLTKGELMNKGQVLKNMMERPLKSFSIDSLLVKSYQNVAIVTVWITQNAEANGKDWSGKFLETDVWVKIKGIWKVTTRHSTWLNKN